MCARPDHIMARQDGTWYSNCNPWLLVSVCLSYIYYRIFDHMGAAEPAMRRVLS